MSNFKGNILTYRYNLTGSQFSFKFGAISFILATLNFRWILLHRVMQLLLRCTPTSTHLCCALLLIHLCFCLKYLETTSCRGSALSSLVSSNRDHIIVTSFFEPVGGIWCAVRSIICSVFDLASCLDCRSMSSLHISMLCSVYIRLTTGYTHTAVSMHAKTQMQNQFTIKFFTYNSVWKSYSPVMLLNICASEWFTDLSSNLQSIHSWVDHELIISLSLAWCRWHPNCYIPSPPCCPLHYSSQLHCAAVVFWSVLHNISLFPAHYWKTRQAFNLLTRPILYLSTLFHPSICLLLTHI